MDLFELEITTFAPYHDDRGRPAGHEPADETVDAKTAHSLVAEAQAGERVAPYDKAPPLDHQNLGFPVQPLKILRL